MGFVRQVENNDLLRLNTAGAVLRLYKTTGNVRIHTIARDVFANFIHNQYIALVKQQVRDRLIGDFLQLRLLRDNFLGTETLDQVRIVVCVFDNGNAAEHRCVLQHRATVFLNQLVHNRRTLVMNALGTLLLAQSYGHHLHQAALVRTSERSMRLNAVKQDNAICLGRILIHKYRLMTDTGNAYLHRFHRALYRATHRLFRYAVIAQNLKLTLGGRAAMAAHRRYDERLCALRFYKIHDGPRHHPVVIDTATATSNRNLLTGFDLSANFRTI